VAVYIEGVLVTISIFAILAVSLDLLIGFTGLFTIAQAAVFGIGAYGSALTAQWLGVGFWGGLVAGGLLGAAISLVIALPALRVTGDYLILASFAVQVVLYGLFVNLDITGGPSGLRRVPRPEAFGYVLQTPGEYLPLYLVIAALLILFAWRLVRSPFGLMLAVIREDELLAQALGKRVAITKIKAFLIAGLLAGIAGSLYAHYFAFVDPDSFSVDVSIFILSMVLVGGMGTLWGPILGTVLLIALPELLRFLPFEPGMLGPLRQIVYGAILVAFCFLRPSGLIGEAR
jgi:branched-chain amino acid transport system permease protein